jgi:hypothetical protein
MKKLKSLIILMLIWIILASCGTPNEPHESDDVDFPEPVILSTIDTSAALPSPLCPDPQPTYITDLEVRTPPSLAEPSTLSPFHDPVFGSCLVRVTNRHEDLSPDDPSNGMKNEYSRVDSFNADGSLILVYALEANWYLYDAHSMRPLGQIIPSGVEPRWDADDPNLIYFNDETRLMSYNIPSGEYSTLHEFADDFPRQSVAAVWTRYEGRPSMDTRYWGLMAEDDDWIPVAFLIYDRHTDQVTVRDMRGVPGIQDDVDNVTISPLGNYFLASFDRYCESGQLGDDAHPCGLMVYDRELQNGRSLLRIIGHYDTALDAEGREVIIFNAIDTDTISILDLESGDVTPLFPIDYSHTPIGHHFAGQAFEQPGWALASTYSGGYPDAYTWMDDQVYAVELKAGGRVVRLAHTHSKVDMEMEHDYWAEPQASVNADFTRILFTSNWGRSGTEEVDMYMIELPPDWLNALP